MQRMRAAAMPARRRDQACCGKMPVVAMQYCTVSVGMVLSCGWLPPANEVLCVDIASVVVPLVSLA